MRSLFADAVGLPRQASGTAAGKGGEVGAAATRAPGGVGRAPGKGSGEQPAFNPQAHKVAAGKSGTAHRGYDSKTSVRNAHKSNAFSDWYDNTDGSYTVKTSETPVNYRAADGTWKRIDPTLAGNADGRLYEKANDIGVSFAGTAGGSASADLGRTTSRAAHPSGPSTPGSSGDALVSLSLGGSSQFDWSVAGAAAVSPVVSGNSAEYVNIFSSTDLTLTAENWGLKETWTLTSTAAPNSWTFPLNMTGVSLVNDPKYGWELVDASGAAVGRLSAPFAYDNVIDKSGSRDETHAVDFSLVAGPSGAQSLVMTLDKAWLDDPSRVFPVTVDPTVTVGDAGVRASTYIEYPFSNNNSSDGSLKVGYSDWSSPTVKARSFIYFDTVPLGSGYHVTQANLGIFDMWAATCAAEPFDVYPVTDSNWTESDINTQLTWNSSTYDGPSVGPSMGEVSADPGGGVYELQRYVHHRNVDASAAEHQRGEPVDGDEPEQLSRHRDRRSERIERLGVEDIRLDGDHNQLAVHLHHLHAEQRTAGELDLSHVGVQLADADTHALGQRIGLRQLAGTGNRV